MRSASITLLITMLLSWLLVTSATEEDNSKCHKCKLTWTCLGVILSVGVGGGVAAVFYGIPMLLDEL